ncbi:hypothetical protein AX16_002249 [Volvariella volvacea WC 439]|nr:hypothetical protein AX16_002249 [Volvariella volvacea WC 439]
MILSSILGLVLVALAPFTHAQLDPDEVIVYDAIHNATPIVGTWSSGSRAVSTGSGFANPARMSFTYPLNTGISYSFDEEGNYEIARYRFIGNGSHPTCIVGVISWVHGTYELLFNGSIVMTPFGDGYQQVQDPCAAVSNLIEPFNFTEFYTNWRIFMDPVQGAKLHLFQYDGAPLAPQYRISETPNMLPTRLLRNVSRADGTSIIVRPDGTQLLVQPDGQQVPIKRDLGANDKESAGPPTWSTWSTGFSGILVTLAIASLML